MTTGSDINRKKYHMEKQHPIKRILLYTHNVTGLGHAFRSLAVIKGIRKWRPDIDFLVMSGSSIPHIFLEENIEVLKLPGIKMALGEKTSLKPRYLKSTNINHIFDYRQKLIIDTFDFFKPHVLMVEHNMSGLMNEIVPLLLKKSLRSGSAEDFLLVHLSRGILKGHTKIKAPCNNSFHGAGSLNISRLYDLIYVLEAPELVDFNREFLENDPFLDEKIRYVGPVSNISPGELSEKKKENKPVILINLSRHGRVLEMTDHFMHSMRRTGLINTHKVVILLDPYLDSEKEHAITSSPLCRDAVFLTFTPHFADLINNSEMIICRAGYNTVNEVLITGTKALIIPEYHMSGEQERRVKNIPSDNITVKTEDEILGNDPGPIILELLERKKKPVLFTADKYDAGRKIIQEMEALSRNMFGH